MEIINRTDKELTAAEVAELFDLYADENVSNVFGYINSTTGERVFKSFRFNMTDEEVDKTLAEADAFDRCFHVSRRCVISGAITIFKDMEDVAVASNTNIKILCDAHGAKLKAVLTALKTEHPEEWEHAKRFLRHEVSKWGIDIDIDKI